MERGHPGSAAVKADVGDLARDLDAHFTWRLRAEGARHRRGGLASGREQRAELSERLKRLPHDPRERFRVVGSPHPALRADLPSEWGGETAVPTLSRSSPGSSNPHPALRADLPSEWGGETPTRPC